MIFSNALRYLLIVSVSMKTTIGAKEVEKAFVKNVLYDCEAIKRVMGLTYSQVKNVKEPNFNKLDLILYSATEKIIFGIDQVANISSHPSFDKSLPVVVYVPGYADFLSVTPMVVALTDRGGVNVMSLDTSKLTFGSYFEATTYARFIGEALGLSLAVLKAQGISNIHVIGASLGAHIAGFAGKSFFDATGIKLDRISGIDPANICFINVHVDLRLKGTDANFVDIIHSDGNVLGLIDLPATVNFFPNGGEDQTGCTNIWCNHARSHIHYVESIRHGAAFPAVQCGSYEEFLRGICNENRVAYMGYEVSRSARGNYYLKTGSYPNDDSISGLIYAALPPWHHLNNMQVVKNIAENPVIDKIQSLKNMFFSHALKIFNTKN